MNVLPSWNVSAGSVQTHPLACRLRNLQRRHEAERQALQQQERREGRELRQEQPTNAQRQTGPRGTRALRRKATRMPRSSVVSAANVAPCSRSSL